MHDRTLCAALGRHGVRADVICVMAGKAQDLVRK
jgi:hypothetical protein